MSIVDERSLLETMTPLRGAAAAPRPVRVLHLHAGNMFGGVESSLLACARHRDSFPALQSEFALCFAGPLSAGLIDLGAAPHLLRPVRFSRPWTVHLARRRLRDLLRREHFEVVICYNGWTHAAFAPTVRAAKIPLVFWARDTLRGTHWLERWARRTPPDLALANSNYTRTGVARLFPTVKSEVVTPIISPTQVSDEEAVRTEVRRAQGTPANATVVILAARLERWKGHRELLEALGSLRHCSEWECWLVGGAQRPAEELYLAELKTTAARLGIGDRVRFLGQRRDVRRLLVGADLLCQPNVDPEPFGLTFVEAMFAGLPVVTAGMGGALEILDESCAVLVAPHDARGYQQALERLLGDAPLRKSLGARGRERAYARYTPGPTLERLHGFLQPLVATHGILGRPVAPRPGTEDTQKLRVLHLHSGNMFGGVETVLTTLARIRQECPEMESAIAVCFEGRLSAELRALDVATYRFDEARFRWPWTVWRARAQLRELLRREHFDVAVGHSCWSLALFARTAQAAGVPVVYWAHDIPTGRHWLERRARRERPGLVLANSRTTLAALPRLFPDSPTKVQPTFVHHEPIADRAAGRARIRREFQTPDHMPVILIACRLEPMKGHRVLIEALARLADSPDWRCWIAGGVQRPRDHRYLDELSARVRLAGLNDRVRFLGQRSDVPQLMAAADIYCQPNVEPESFGLTFVEAQFAGLPVVTSAIGGATEIVDDACGLLLRPHDSAALADALADLLRDADRRRIMGRAGAERAAANYDNTRLLREFCSTLAGFHAAQQRSRTQLTTGAPYRGD